MKTLTTITLALFTATTFASVEIKAVSNKIDCTLKDGKITRTQTFGKDNNVGFSQVYDITTTGLEATLKTAEASARPNTSTDRDLIFAANVNGNKFDLAMDDSKEALYVIQMMVKACRFN